MGISTDDDPITLSSGAVAVSGTLTVSDDLKLSEDAAKITHTALSSSTNAGLAISSTNAHVDVESVRPQVPKLAPPPTRTSSPWPMVR